MRLVASTHAMESDIMRGHTWEERGCELESRNWVVQIDMVHHVCGFLQISRLAEATSEASKTRVHVVLRSSSSSS